MDDKLDLTNDIRGWTQASRLKLESTRDPWLEGARRDVASVGPLVKPARLHFARTARAP